MTDEVLICATAFAVYAAAAVRRMDAMPAVLTLDGFDFSWRHPLRMGADDIHLPNLFRPDACLIERPVDAQGVSRLRELARDLVPFQIASLASAAILFAGVPMAAARTSLLLVLIGAYVASSLVVVGTFATSTALGRIGVLDPGMARILLAAAISPPTAINLARDVAQARLMHQ